MSNTNPDTRYVTTQISQPVHVELRVHALRAGRDVRDVVTEAVAAYLATAGGKTDGGAR